MRTVSMSEYKTHFDPYCGEEDDDLMFYHAPCGTLIGNEYNVTDDWDEVDCKRCITSKDRLIKWSKERDS